MDTIDVKGLPDDQVRLLSEIVHFLKTKAWKERKRKQGDEERILFADYDSNVIGRLTREEIYDHL